MYELDLLDRKVVYELGKNSRQSYKQIAKNIHSKKETMAYRIKQLVSKKIITKFIPVFSLSKLNIFSGKIYLKLHGLDKLSEKKLITELMNDPDIIWVARSVGRWDLLLGLYTKNNIEFSRIKNKILSINSKYVQEYSVSHNEDALVFNRDYLIKKPVEYRQQFVFGGEVESNLLKKDELKLISLIKNNARFESTEISKELNIDARTVINKLKSMQKRQILQGFTVFLDLKKIGIDFHKLCIYLQNYEGEKLDQFVSFLKSNPNTIHLIKCLGSWEIEVEIESDKDHNIYDYINEIKNKFPSLVKQIDLITITDEIKLEFFPSVNLYK